MKSVKAKILLTTTAIIMTVCGLVIYFLAGSFSDFKKLSAANVKADASIFAVGYNNRIKEVSLSLKNLAVTGKSAQAYFDSVEGSADEALLKEEYIDTVLENALENYGVLTAAGLYYDSGGDYFLSRSGDEGGLLKKESVLHSLELAALNLSEEEKISFSPPFIDSLNIYLLAATELDGEGQARLAYAVFDITELSIKAMAVMPTANSIALLADIQNGVISRVNDSRISHRDLTGKSTDNILWLNAAVNANGDTVKIYGEKHLLVSVKLSGGMSFISCVPTKELYKKADDAVFMIVCVFIGSVVLAAAVLAVIINVSVKKPAKKLYESLALLNSQSQIVEEYYLSGGESQNMAALPMPKNETKAFNSFPDLHPRNEARASAMFLSAQIPCGDFYDVFFIAENKLCIMAGDVCGRGINSTAFSSTVKTVLKTNAALSHSPKVILERANKQLYKDADDNIFASVYLGVLDIKSGELIYTNAGYPMPYIVFKAQEAARLTQKQPQLPVAALSDTQYLEYAEVLQKGEKLFVAANGITNLENSVGERFGDDRLFEFIYDNYNLCAENLIIKLDEEQSVFAGGMKSCDDLVLCAVEYLGEPEFSHETVLNGGRAQLEEVLEFISGIIRKGMEEKDVTKIMLAAEEIYVDIASFAYNATKKRPTEWDSPDKNSRTIYKKGFITVRAAVLESPKKFVMQFEDNGAPHNPFEGIVNDASMLDGNEGMGLLMVKNIAAHISYERKKSKNITTVTIFCA